MNFIKEYGVTVGLLVFIFGMISGMYFYYAIYIPRRDAPMIAAQKLQQDVLDAKQKKIEDANSVLYRQACTQVEAGNQRTLAFQITSCGKDQACIDYAKNTIQVGSSYIETCIHLKQAENLH